MSTASPVPELVPAERNRVAGRPAQRYAARRRREKALSVLVLVAAFAATVVLLALQWLGGAQHEGSAPPTRPAATVQVH